jgi:hypothetical protein
MGVVQGRRVHEQRGRKGHRQLFDCHQYCGIICVVLSQSLTYFTFTYNQTFIHATPSQIKVLTFLD